MPARTNDATRARSSRLRRAERLHEVSASLRNVTIVARMMADIGSAATNKQSVDARTRLSALRDRIRRKELDARTGP